MFREKSKKNSWFFLRKTFFSDGKSESEIYQIDITVASKTISTNVLSVETLINNLKMGQLVII